MRKKAILVLAVLLTGLSFAQPPEPPHRVYGDINDTDGPVDGLDIDFRYSGDSKASATTNSTGFYDLKIPYSSNYDGNNLELYVENSSTGKTVEFNSGSSTKINYTGTNLRRDSFNVTGEITINDSTQSGYVVSAYHGNDNITSNTTESDGGYKLVIPFSDDYDGEELSLYVRGIDTGETFTFRTGESTSIDYEEDNTEDGTGGTGTNGDDEEDETDNETENEDSDSNNVTDDGSDEDSPDSLTGEASISIQSIEVIPQVAEIGENVTIEVTLENTGGAAGSFDLELDLGSKTVTKNAPNIGAGETTTVELTEAFDDSGDYTIGSGDFSVELTIQEASNGGLSLFQMMGLGSIVLFLFVGFYKGYQILSKRNSGGSEDDSKGAFDSFRSQKEEEGDDFNWRYQDKE